VAPLLVERGGGVAPLFAEEERALREALLGDLPGGVGP
jgi:hypothetical protein